MFGTKYKGKSLLREALSENGIGSSKRLFGLIIILVCLGCTIYLTVTEGGTHAVESLLDTEMIVACALLGLSSVTSIWKTDCKEENKETEE